MYRPARATPVLECRASKPHLRCMVELTRRTLLVSATAAAAARGLPQIARTPAARRIIDLVRDKAAGGMRAVEKVVR